ncbi:MULTISPECIES: hypothetical protein [Candidatus Ichthyocystis]|uniref:hypothetical protein n=1 Tax=Candidatus Ichthyocystis TaxID=2929841 RepID=UPI000B8959EB|nr:MULTISPECIES: hypothetical protein [Ichthyocystis]
MSADILEIAREIKKRERLVNRAREIVEENKKNLELALQAEGVSMEFLDIAQKHLTDKERDTIQKMYDVIQKEISRMAEEKADSSPVSNQEQNGEKDIVTDADKDVSVAEVPVDVALKGGFAAAGDKKVRKKKKKDWI